MRKVTQNSKLQSYENSKFKTQNSKLQFKTQKFKAEVLRFRLVLQF